ncbi:MAG: LacI family DNA-binding transcriptional regulator [Enterocloster asparagiformis]|nr:LacI family DNA-binding transcriptional regulator [Enterocloster asparagiformis]
MTLKEISEKTGFSITTISRVMNRTGYVNDETYRKIMQAAEAGGYFQKKKNSALNNNIVGVVVPDLSNPFFAAVIKGIKEVTESMHKEVVIMDTSEDFNKEKRALALMQSLKLCGLIITPVSDYGQGGDEIEKTLTDLNVPVVLVDRDVKNSAFDGVFINNTQGAFEITSYLIQKGYSRIAIISGPRYSKPGRERLKGYKNALEKYGITPDEKLIFEGDFSLESGYALTERLLELPELPQAVFSCNNLMTMGCVKALATHKVKIGKDIQVAGFDKPELIDQVMDLKLAVVDRPTVEMGRTAAEILLQKPKLPESSVIRSGIRVNLMPKLKVYE